MVLGLPRWRSVFPGVGVLLAKTLSAVPRGRTALIFYLWQYRLQINLPRMP